jgi:hypothetical protein
MKDSNFGECCKSGEQGQCCGKSHQQNAEKHSDCPKHFLELADKAWMELLKDKIKIEIENKKGAELEKLAEIIAKANGKKWKHKIAAEMECEDYKNTLKDFFTSSDK